MIRCGWNRSGDMGHHDAEGWLYFDFRAGAGQILQMIGQFYADHRIFKMSC